MNGTDSKQPPRIPRQTDDYSEAAAQQRRSFISEQTGASLQHSAHYSQTPAQLAGNIELFSGVAQVPLGFAGPLKITGEHAQGDFYIPMATTEGTLLASYNRGMRLLSECGGVTTTITREAMQRSPVFRFANARKARDFGDWVAAHFEQIREVAQATTARGLLNDIMPLSVGPTLHLRFNYSTGDAAGQNMVSKATLAACLWIREQHSEHPEFLLSGNTDTDKKHSQINTLLTRGRRVVAEATIKREILRELMRVDTEALFHHRQISQAGAFMAGSANNGSHAANGLAAMFIATGQDAANIAESHAGIVYSQLLENGDYYWSITLPSLIVASYGGGTGLASQRECLEVLGCYGEGKAAKLAEICAAVVLAGETSLSAAVLAGDWVSSHDRYGRNRP